MESLEVYVRRYLDWLSIKNYSSQTVYHRREVMDYFLCWCNERALTDPKEISRPLLERYQRYVFLYRKRDGEPLAPRTQLHRMSNIRLFFKWMVRQGYLDYSPASDLELPRIDKRLPKEILSEREAEMVLAVPDVSTPQGIRDRAILETFYSTGVRRSELIALKLKDIDSERGTIMVRLGKGKKDRLIPISERALQWVIAYRDKVRPAMPGETALFLNNKGKPFTVRQISDFARERIEAANIGKSGSCHVFRHTMATLMLEHGADIRYVQEMLGHSCIESTQAYTKVSISKLKEVHTKTHPGKVIQAKGGF